MAIENEKWWESDRAHEIITGNIEALTERQNYRTERYLQFMRLYGNRYYSGFGGSEYASGDLQIDDSEERLVLNVIQSVIDACTAKISTNRPRPMPITEGGTWDMRKKAKDLDQFIDGQFYASKVYKTTRKTFKDACIFGNGPAHVYTDYRDPDNPMPRVERVFPIELWVDEVDAKNGNPRQLYRIKEVGREILLNDPDFGKYKSQIMDSGLVGRDTTIDETLANPVTVMEAWHLPSAPGASDGKRVFCTSKVTLVEADWTRERFPFPMFRYNEPILGWDGQGLAEIEKGIQVEINKILRKVQQHMHLASSFVCVNRGSKIVKSHLVNTPWSLLEYTGDKPVFETVASISPEYFAQLDRLYSRAFEIAGITQLFAQGAKPPGLDSGKALAEFKASESARFATTEQQFEDYHIEIAECLIDEAKTIDEYLKAKGKGSYGVLAKDERLDALRRIEWQDINLDRDKYILQIHPTSYLPKLPAFRFQAVKNILEAVPEVQPDALVLLDYPDLKAVTDRLTASNRYINQQIDRMLYSDPMEHEEFEDLYEAPDSFTDLPRAMTVARGKYLDAKMQGCPEERLELLRRYMTTVEKLMRPPEPPPMAEGMGPGMEEPAGPGMGPEGPPGMPGEVNINPRISVEAPPAPIPIPGR